VTKDRYICNLLPKVKPVKTIGFGTLISSVALIVSTLCLQAAITQHAPTGNKGPKDSEQRSVDPSSEIDSAREHKLRLRLLTLEPGSVVELRSHKDHPTVLHVIKGILTSYSQNRPEVVLRAGVGLAEGKDSNFWVQNIGSEPAEFIWLPVYESAP
jgi:quercetin dioxygenase-like cupin family protein